MASTSVRDGFISQFEFRFGPDFISICKIVPRSEPIYSLTDEFTTDAAGEGQLALLAAPRNHNPHQARIEDGPGPVASTEDRYP